MGEGKVGRKNADYMFPTMLPNFDNSVKRLLLHKR